MDFCRKELPPMIISKLTMTYEHIIFDEQLELDEDDELIFIVSLSRRELADLIDNLLPYALHALQHNTKQTAQAMVIHLTDFYDNMSMALH